MKNSLEILDDLVCERLNPATAPDPGDPSVVNEHWINQAAKECKHIRTCLLTKSVDIQKEEGLLLLVQQYQAVIIRLLDQIFSYNILYPDTPLKEVHGAIMQHLKELLLFIEYQYPKYFNKEEKVPDLLMMEYQAKLKKELKTLDHSLFAKIDSRLRQIICNHLQKFHRRNSQVFITYKTIAYLKELISEFKDLPATSSNATDLLMDLLIQMNFNTAELLSYYVDLLQVSITTCEMQVRNIETLLKALKKLNQLQLKPGVAFKPQMPTLKEQIVGWISEEIYYLERQQSLFNTPYMQLQPVHEKDEEEKLHTALSVQQLAIFIRAARDTGMLTNKNQTALLKTVAKVFRTPYAETISADSLRIKYYLTEPGATKSVKDLLMEMFKKVQAY